MMYTRFNKYLTAISGIPQRFPLASIFLIGLVIHLFRVIYDAFHTVPGGESLQSDTEIKTKLVIGYYLVVGYLLSLSLALWKEELHRKYIGVITSVLLHLALIADSVYLYYIDLNQLRAEIFLAHLAMITALLLSLFIAPFFREKDDIASYLFSIRTLSFLNQSHIIGLVMWGGISLIFLSISTLFNIDIDTVIYFYIAVLTNVLLAQVLFLSQIPEGSHKISRQIYTSYFIERVTQYLFLPLVCIYALILYIYGIQILIVWQLPNGWVSWLVTTLVLGIIALEYLIYMPRQIQTKKVHTFITCYLPLIALPLLLLMTIGIFRRISDYGVTIHRLYLLVFNAWCYLVCIGLFLTRSRRLQWISISFSLLLILTSVGPQNLTALTRRIMLNDVRAVFNRHKGRLPLDAQQLKDFTKRLPKEQRTHLYSQLAYLEQYYGQNSIASLVTSNAILGDEVEADTLVTLIEFHHNNRFTPVPPGAVSLIPVKHYIDHPVIANDTLLIELTSSNDSLDIHGRLPMRQLKEIRRQPATDALRYFRCTPRPFIFYISDLELSNEKATISGTLFEVKQ